MRPPGNEASPHPGRQRRLRAYPAPIPPSGVRLRGERFLHTRRTYAAYYPQKPLAGAKCPSGVRLRGERFLHTRRTYAAYYPQKPLAGAKCPSGVRLRGERFLCTRRTMPRIIPESHWLAPCAPRGLDFAANPCPILTAPHRGPLLPGVVRAGAFSRDIPGNISACRLLC